MLPFNTHRQARN